MKHGWHVGTTVIGLGLALGLGGAACKSKEPAQQGAGVRQATPGSAATPALPAGDAAVAVVADAGLGIDADVYASETTRLVEEAFGGKLPALPLLSADGEMAAVDLSESIGLSDASTYEIGFLGKKLDRVLLLDRKTAATIAEGKDPKLDRNALKKSADAVKQRLVGFTPFARVMDPEALNDAPPASTPDSHATALGTAVLEWSSTGDLKLRLTDAKGTQLAAETVKQVKGSDAPGDCGGSPNLSGVWVDEPRHRVLLRVDYAVGGDTCGTLPGSYRLWKL